MRAFALLFAFYLTLLSCLPCTDEGTREGELAATALTTSPAADDSHEHAPDWCSPLCQCHCCAAVTLPTSLAATFPEAVVSVWATRSFAELVSPAPTRRGTGAWQPPRA